MKTRTDTDSFYRGFARAAQLPLSAAWDQWGGFSNQLSDRERAAIEAGGYASGLTEGQKFLAMYPPTKNEPTHAHE